MWRFPSPHQLGKGIFLPYSEVRSPRRCLKSLWMAQGSLSLRTHARLAEPQLSHLWFRIHIADKMGEMLGTEGPGSQRHLGAKVKYMSNTTTGLS